MYNNSIFPNCEQSLHVPPSKILQHKHMYAFGYTILYRSTSAISRAALEKLRNPYLLNFYERLAGLLFTAAKVRLRQSSAASAE